MKRSVIALILILVYLLVGGVGVVSADTIMVLKKKTSSGFDFSTYLEAYYHFETADLGGDETANANDLSSVGTPTASATHYVDGSTALRRDATDDSVYRHDTNLAAGFPAKASTGYQNYLITGWIYLNSTPGAGTAYDILSKYCAVNSERAWKMTINDTPAFRIQLSSAGTSQTVSKIFSSTDGTGWPDTLVASKWYFVAMWHDQALDKYGAYIYNATDAIASTYFSTAFSTGINVGSGSTAAFCVGCFMCSDSTTGQFLDGWVDRVAVYGWPDSATPSESEIQTQIAALQALTAP